MTAPLPGPDGFLPAPDDPLLAEQVRLNDFLLAEELRADRTPPDLKTFKRLKQQDFSRQIEALLQRIAWLWGHDAELETGHVARRRLTTLLASLHKALRETNEKAARFATARRAARRPVFDCLFFIKRRHGAHPPPGAILPLPLRRNSSRCSPARHC